MKVLRMEIPNEIKNFEEIEKFVKESKLPYRDAIIAYYKKIGENLNFTVMENFSVLKYGLNLGKIELLWVEPNIVFTVEFSNLENLIGKLFKIIEFMPNLAVLVVSSSSGCKPKDVKKLIQNSKFFQEAQRRVAIIDLAEKQVMSV